MERAQITDAVYVGDTKGDADACTFAGIPFIFAEYGFGSPTHYAHKITRFPELLNILFKKVSEHCPLRYFSSSPDNPDMHALSQTDAHMYPLL